MVQASFRCLRIALVFLAIGQASLIHAQRLDSFEGGTPRWRLVESDCSAQIAGQEISPVMPHGGRSSELFELACSAGQFALMAYPIEPCAVLNEFQPSVWCRCASSQIRLGVRVVFPMALHPTNHIRMTTILWGDAYKQPGQWERLQIKQVGDRLQQEVIAIRNQFDTTLNLDKPYIDALVINAYTGPGRTRVQLDDLDIGSLIPLASIGVTLPPDWRDKWCWRDDSHAQFNASNQLPIWVENRGEQPAWLKSLGFNGMLMSQIPSPAQLDQVYDAGISVISPPPEHLVEFDEKKLAAVKGWLIGVALNRKQADLARQQAAFAERLPKSLKRPLYGEALEQYWLFGRIANEVIVPAPDPVSAGDTIAKREWLIRNLETAKHRGEGWVSILVGANPALADQYNAVAERLHGAKPSVVPANPMGLRHEVIGALASGAKGILYRTQSPLLDPISSQAAEDRALQAAIRWTNGDLRTWSPWINFGQQAPPPQLDRTDFAATCWRVRDSDLIICQNISPHSQRCVPGTRNGPLSVSQPGRQDPHEVVRLTEGRMELVRVERSSGTESWQVTSPNSIEVFVATGDPQVLQYLRQSLNSRSNENASDQLEIANYTLEQASELIDARFRIRSSDQAAEMTTQQQRLMTIQQLLQRGWQELQARQPENATGWALQAMDRTQAIMHESYLTAISNLATPQSSPMVLMPGMLKYHWLMADACQRSNWQAVQLPGSQFANLDEMLEKGWTQHRRLEDLVDLRVELLPATNETQSSLRLAAYSKSISSSGKAFDPIPGGYEGASLVVHSSGAPVKRGQLVRISAVARVTNSGSDPASGLLIYDNQGGPSLGQLVRGKPGDRIPIELYRSIHQDSEFRLSTECRGTCDIRLESVSMSVIEPAADRTSYETSPLQPGLLSPNQVPPNSASSETPLGTRMQR